MTISMAKASDAGEAADVWGDPDKNPSYHFSKTLNLFYKSGMAAYLGPKAFTIYAFLKSKCILGKPPVAVQDRLENTIFTHISVENGSRETGISRAEWFRAITKLRDAGLLLILKVGSNTVAYYVIGYKITDPNGKTERIYYDDIFLTTYLPQGFHEATDMDMILKSTIAERIGKEARQLGY